jgi:hypothetical protein
MEMEIKETFYQAFQDKLKETLASPKPDFEWMGNGGQKHRF